MVKVVANILLIGVLLSESLDRGDPNYRRVTNIDVNKIRVSIQNYGSSGNDLSGPGVFFYEWPTNSGRGYIAYQGLYVGAEVTTNNGGKKAISYNYISNGSRREIDGMGTGSGIFKSKFL